MARVTDRDRNEPSMCLPDQGEIQMQNLIDAVRYLQGLGVTPDALDRLKGWDTPKPTNPFAPQNACVSRPHAR